MQTTIELPVCDCQRCGWHWIAKTPELPIRCPNPECRSPYWQTKPKPQKPGKVKA